MLPSRTSRILLLVLALAATACDGPRTRATYTNIPSTFALFALTGAPANTPSGISFLSSGTVPGGMVIADANFRFDVAVDIDAGGVTRVYPVRALAGAIAGPVKRVGLQTVSGPFEAVTEAPEAGYDTLNAKVVTPGTVIAVELQEIYTTCLYSLSGSNLYAKMVIDSIKIPTRRVYGRSVFDPNCGYRELRPDTLPER